MFNVLPEDVHKNIIKKIVNDMPISFISGYKLKYVEGIKNKINPGTILYFPYKNSNFLYFKETDNICYYPEENSLLIVDKPLEVITSDNLENFKVIIGKNNISIE